MLLGWVHDVEQACTELLRVAACASKIAAPGDAAFGSATNCPPLVILMLAIP
jgi:hypothetical protein